MDEGRAPDLSLVVPAYNEAAVIRQTVTRWLDVLEGLGIAHEVVVVDDGSTDVTGEALDALAAARPVVRVIHQPNRGHGPAVLTGYRAARGAWVLQVDADDEVGPGPFPSVWQERHNVDLLLGVRAARRQRASRAIVSWSLGRLVGLLAGRTLRDANSPYRLQRREVLVTLLAAVPEGAFAPNALVSALAVARGLRVAERVVPLVAGRESASLGGLRLLRAAGRSLAELATALRAERARPHDPPTR